MGRKLFLNLAVADLPQAVDFFTALGFTFDARFTDESATCMVVNDETSVMLLVAERFQEFTKRQLCDSSTHTEAIVALSADSRAEVDDLVHRALGAGGKPANDPMDLGCMYGWSFYDPDGHLWEVLHMDADALPADQH